MKTLVSFVCVALLSVTAFAAATQEEVDAAHSGMLSARQAAVDARTSADAPRNTLGDISNTAYAAGDGYMTDGDADHTTGDAAGNLDDKLAAYNQANGHFNDASTAFGTADMELQARISAQQSDFSRYLYTSNIIHSGPNCMVMVYAELYSTLGSPACASLDDFNDWVTNVQTPWVTASAGLAADATAHNNVWHTLDMYWCNKANLEADEGTLLGAVIMELSSMLSSVQSAHSFAEEEIAQAELYQTQAYAAWTAAGSPTSGDGYMSLMSGDAGLAGVQASFAVHDSDYHTDGPLYSLLESFEDDIDETQSAYGSYCLALMYFGG